MDPLVRSTLWVQRQFWRGAGTALAALFGGYLVLYTLDPRPRLETWVALTAFVASTAYRAYQRLRRPPAEDESTRLDLELFAHLTVAAYAGVLRAPGGLAPPCGGRTAPQ